MRLLLGMVFFFLLGAPHTAWAATTRPSVKDVALAFGEAILHNDGGAALALLAPDLRRRTAANQLPAILGVQRPPLSVHVVRWAYDNGNGDATLSMRYAAAPVAEHLYLHLFGEGWRITAIVPENSLTLQRGAEAAVVTFCDAAVRGDLRTMRRALIPRLATHATDAEVVGLLALPGPLVSYTVVSYYGGPAGANVIVKLHAASAAVQATFIVINDRDGWRIADVTRAGTQ